MNTAELRKKTTEDLGKELVELRKAQFNSRMQVATQQTSKNDQLGKLRKDIARVMTILTEKNTEKKGKK